MAEAIQIMAVTELNRSLSSKQIKELESFLKALTGSIRKIEIPDLPE